MRAALYRRLSPIRGISSPYSRSWWCICAWCCSAWPTRRVPCDKAQWAGHGRADTDHNKPGAAVTPEATPVWALPEAAALDRAKAALVRVQRPGGDWEDEMVWCTMVTSQWVMVQRIVNRPIGAERGAGIIRY